MKILKFSSDYCMACKNLAKQLENTDLPIINYNVDTDEAEPLIDKYNIRNVPVLVFIDDNGNELKRIVGAVSKQVVIDTYNQLND